ncbi:MAG: hypothetical protein MJ067_02840, partial [Oscillospiraceae bacterium]|nr:hypothetical protein [Oscillospiraceae bacterium]
SSYSELSGEKGSVRFAIDESALFLKGKDCGLKIIAKLKRGETASLVSGGCVLNLGESSYLITVKKGRLSLTVEWDLKGLCSTDPIIEILPEEDVFEAVFYDTDRALEIKKGLSEAFAEAKSKQEEGFKSFCTCLKSDAEEAAYRLYSSFMSFSGRRLLAEDKKRSVYADALINCLAAMAFSSADEGARLLTGPLGAMSKKGICPGKITASGKAPETYAPLWGLLLLCSSDIKSLSSSLSSELYELIGRAVCRWEKDRRTKEGAFFYAYPFEGGIKKAPILPIGEAAYSPDLEALMAANYRLLSILAPSRDEAGLFEEKKDLCLRRLASYMRDGKYICKSAVSEAEAPCPGKTSLITELSIRAASGDLFKASPGDIDTIFSVYGAGREKSSLFSAIYSLSKERK